MAEQADVETALVDAIALALYPNGPAQASAVGATVRVYRGWPQASGLDADLNAGWVNVSVFPVAGTHRTLPRFPGTRVTRAQALGVSVQICKDTLIFTGEATSGEVVGVLADGVAYRYPTVAGDTALSVTEVVAELIRVDRPALVLNATLRVPGAYQLIGRVVGTARASREVRRQVQQFRVTLWCPTPESRDATAAIVDLSLASTPFLALADGSAARLVCVGGETTDKNADATLYRRDLLLDAEYPTTITETLPCVLFGDLVLNTAARLV